MRVVTRRASTVLYRTISVLQENLGLKWPKYWWICIDQGQIETGSRQNNGLKQSYCWFCFQDLVVSQMKLKVKVLKDWRVMKREKTKRDYWMQRKAWNQKMTNLKAEKEQIVKIRVHREKRKRVDKLLKVMKTVINNDGSSHGNIFMECGSQFVNIHWSEKKWLDQVNAKNMFSWSREQVIGLGLNYDSSGNRRLS